VDVNYTACIAAGKALIVEMQDISLHDLP